MRNLVWIKEKAQILARRFKLRLIVLYGSQAQRLSGERSDIDLALLFDDPSPQYILDLFNILSEIFEGEHLDIVILNHCDPLLTFEVACFGICLYEKEEGIFDNFQISAFRIHVDAQKFYLAEKEAIHEFIKYGTPIGKY